MKTVNYSIDLGTTNSLIAKYENGQQEVFKNPIGNKETLPSCVSFRGGKIMVGDKARSLIEKDPKNVFSSFKRKMGSEETYYVPSLDQSITPIELSSLVLKELKNFVYNEDVLNEVVITIPASFDTIQSNATKVAGEKAGFQEVYLLQEPIAAVLAFANKSLNEVEKPSQWLVYDLGGGTFDVALLSVNKREIKILDNQGNNFLGGLDFDNLIVEKLIVPKLEEDLNEEGLWTKMTSKNSSYEKLYHELLFKAEEAKKELSVMETTEIDIDIDAHDYFETVTLSKAAFNAVIHETVEETLKLMQQVLKDNQLANSEIEKVILIGGSTYIPYVREQITSKFNIQIDASVDPTSAVAIGASYYAGTKMKKVTAEAPVKEEDQKLAYKLVYEKNSRDLEELLSLRFETEDHPVAFYRITRTDGGFDTGIKKASQLISEFVNLLEGRMNSFEIKLLDKNQNPIQTVNGIYITQGKFSVQGQVLPNDICLEIDDIDFETTRLEVIFAKNKILPLRKTIYKTSSKTILKGSDERLIINIVEGKGEALPSSGLCIGYIEISGKDLEEDLIRGTDIEIELTISESRDLTVKTYLSSCDQEFENVFKPTDRSISLHKINMEINNVIDHIDEEISKHNVYEDYDQSQVFNTIREQLIELQMAIVSINENDVTDKKFQIDNKKRELIFEFDRLTRHKTIDEAVEAYYSEKEAVLNQLSQTEDPKYQKQFDRIIENEKFYVNSKNLYLLKSKTKELDNLYYEIFSKRDENFVAYYISYRTVNLEEFKDVKKAQKLFEQGDMALDKNQYTIVKNVVYQLSALFKDDDEGDKKKKFDDSSKTGLK